MTLGEAAVVSMGVLERGVVRRGRSGLVLLVVVAALVSAACVPPDPGGSTTTTTEPAAPVVVTGAQLTWSFNQYAQYGVFGAWSQAAAGERVSLTELDGQAVSGDAADAGRPFTTVRFDGGSGEFDATGAGSISWGDTGSWTLNAYSGAFGAPDETFSDPILDIEADGSGVLSFEVFIPAALDMGGAPTPAVGPLRVPVATFASVLERDSAGLRVDPTFEGRLYVPAAGGAPQLECTGSGGSWPAEYINFVPASVRAHYYSTGCEGLNAKKPPLPFSVVWAADPISITQQPTLAPEVLAGSTQTVKVLASGTPTPRYQWQRSIDGSTWVDIAGATSYAYRFAANLGSEGDSFRVVLSAADGSTLTSDPVVLHVEGVAPTFRFEPSDRVVAIGEDTSFNAGFAGSPTPELSFERSNDNGATWFVVPSSTYAADSNGLTPVPSPQLSDNGALFRAILDNGVGDRVVSRAASLTVTETAPTFLLHPEDQTVAAGGSVEFIAWAEAAPPPTYQWQRSNDGGTTWIDVSGEVSFMLTFSPTAADNGARFRVIASNGIGEPITSTPAILTVT